MVRTLILLPLLFVTAVLAQNPPTPTQLQGEAQSSPAEILSPAKIAFVNIQMAVATCDEGKKELAAHQQFRDGKSAELQEKQKTLDALKNQYDIMGSKLTDEARNDMAESIDAKDTELQRFQQDTQKKLDKRLQKIQNAIARKVLTVVEKISKERGLSWVGLIDPNRDAYINPSLDITQDIIKAYNVAYPTQAVVPVKK